jgi:hypothetical protein
LVGEAVLATAPLGLPIAKLSLLLSTAGIASSVFEQAVASSSAVVGDSSVRKEAVKIGLRCFAGVDITKKPGQFAEASEMTAISTP